MFFFKLGERHILLKLGGVYLPAIIFCDLNVLGVESNAQIHRLWKSWITVRLWEFLRISQVQSAKGTKR